jgi:hypothetical protein
LGGRRGISNSEAHKKKVKSLVLIPVYITSGGNSRPITRIELVSYPHEGYVLTN